MSDQQWFSVTEFSKLIGYSKRYVHDLIKARLISTARRTGKRTSFKIPRSEVIKWGLIKEEENHVDLETL